MSFSSFSTTIPAPSNPETIAEVLAPMLALRAGAHGALAYALRGVSPMPYIPAEGELVEVVEVHSHDHCPSHAPGDVVRVLCFHPCKDGFEGFPMRCAADVASCIYLRSETLPAVGTWCNVKPASAPGSHQTHWLRAVANAVRAAMQADPELAVTWLETARGLEEFATEFHGIAARIADASGLTLSPRERGRPEHCGCGSGRSCDLHAHLP